MHDRLVLQHSRNHDEWTVSILNNDNVNPVATLDRVLRIAERVAFTTSAFLVFGTIGYLSLHILA